MNKKLIILISILTPLLVTALFFLIDTEIDALWLHMLPFINAVLNAITAIILLFAVYFIKKGNENMHENLIKIAFGLGALFLLSYVTYHSSVPSTIYGDINGDGTLQMSEKQTIGLMRSFYIGLLLSHILMAFITLPLVLTAFSYGLRGERSKHKKIVKYAFPVWLYVSITGPIIYILISPYY